MKNVSNLKISDSQTDEKEEGRAVLIKKCFRRFAEQTTAHGYAHVAMSQSIIGKIFWTSAIITFHVFLLMHIITLIDKYKSQPVSTHNYVRKLKNPVFPAVVLCNNNMVRNGSIQEIKKEFIKYNITNGVNKINIEITKDRLNALAEIIGDRIHDYGHQFHDFIYSCTWTPNINCTNLNDWKRFWHSQYGTCFVFNSALLGSPDKVRFAAYVGPKFSIEVILNIQQDLYFDKITKSAGVRIYVGDPESFHEPYVRGQSLSPGFEYAIGTRRFEVVRAKDCIPPVKKQYFFHGMNFSVKYQSEICTESCLTEYIFQKCGCIDPLFPRTRPDAKLCVNSEEDENCEEEAKKQFQEISDCSLKCLPACKETNYLTDISFLQFPSTSQLISFDISQDVRENYLKILVYYNTFNVQISEAKLFYEFQDLLSDIGGQLGLFSGYSFLTLVEFFSLAVVLSTLIMKGRKLPH